MSKHFIELDVLLKSNFYFSFTQSKELKRDTLSLYFSSHPLEEIHCNCVQTKHCTALCSTLAGSEVATADISLSLSLYRPGPARCSGQRIGCQESGRSENRYFHFRGKIVIHLTPWLEPLLFSRDDAKLDYNLTTVQ